VGWINLFEVPIAVRRFEDVLMDIASDTAEINRLADMITGYQLKRVHYLLARELTPSVLAMIFSTQVDLNDVAAGLGGDSSSPASNLLDEAGPCAGQESLFSPYLRMRPQAFGGFLPSHGPTSIGRNSTFYDQPGSRPAVAARQKIATRFTPNRGGADDRSTPAEVRSAVLKLVDIFSMGPGRDRGFTWRLTVIPLREPFSLD